VVLRDHFTQDTPVTDTDNAAPIPEGIDRILKRFATLSPDLVRQALVQYAHKLPPLPERFQNLDPDRYRVHECQTPVAIFPEVEAGRMYFHADVPQGAPTIRALLAMLFEALNGQPPAVTLAIPSDFVRQVMSKLGLGTREVGLNAIVERLKRAARAAQDHGGPGGAPASIGA
jgi:cysteine desulfuration protein SufE